MSESTGEHETPMPAEGEQADPMAPPDESETQEMDLEDKPAEAPPAPVLAEPGVYVCVAENVGEHAVLGRLEQGQDYDYTQEQNPAVLQAVAGYVEAGVLEKKDTGTTGDEPRDH